MTVVIEANRDGGPPLPPHIGKHIFGINIVRSAKDLTGAPRSLIEGFHKVMNGPSLHGEIRCPCCAKGIGKVGGLAVLRTTLPGPESVVAMPMCKKCLAEPNGVKLTRRIHKTLTGFDRPFVDWKDLLQ